MLSDYDDYQDDPCYECRDCGNDYYLDDEGELVCACDDRPFDIMSTRDDDYDY